MGTKSQKICAVVLGLAVVAFVVDRCVIAEDTGGVASASEYQVNFKASPSSPTTPAAKQPASVPATVATAATAAAPARHATSLASRLAAASEARRLTAHAVADAFQPSQAWVTANAPPPPPAPKTEAARPPAAQPKVDHVALFVQRHTLTAVMKDRDGGMAIINGKLYKVGQYVGGFKLTRVGLTDASFWGKGAGAKLKLAGQYPAAASAR